MVNFKSLSSLADKAKDVIEKRGGTDTLKQDAEQLKGIAKGPGSLAGKAKAAAEALKHPGTESRAEEKPAEATAEKAEKPAKAKKPAKAGEKAQR